MTNKANCTVYIDESGDLGIGKGTRWFVITAVIVEKQNEKELRSIISNLKKRLNIQTVHFRELREFSKRLLIVSELRDAPFTTVNVIVDTDILDLKDGVQTYNYMSKILLERVSWYLRDHGMCADVIFSSRNSKRDNELTNYLRDKVLNYDWNYVVKGTIVSVESRKMETLDLLQLADICAASMFKAYEPDPMGFIYPCFMNNLKTHLYNRNGRTMSYGVKFYKKEMKPDKNYINAHAPCNHVAKK